MNQEEILVLYPSAISYTININKKMQVLSFLQQCNEGFLYSGICHSNPSQNTGILSTTKAVNVLARYGSYKSEQIRVGITLLLLTTFPLGVFQMADICNTRYK